MIPTGTDSSESSLTDSPLPESAGHPAQQVEPSPVMVQGRPLQELPDDLFIPPEALEVFLESFQGPLDLLLYLIRRQNLDILDIPVALITRQYMDYVELMRQFRLDLAAEYLVMAATLAEIKSRMLLPKPVSMEDCAEEDPRLALIRRLQDYERFRQAAQEIDDRPRLERDTYLLAVEFEDPNPCKVEPRVTLNDLIAAFRDVLDRAEYHRYYGVEQETLTVRDKMVQILDRLQRDCFLRFEDLFDPAEGRLGMVVSFIAILEMCRDQVLVMVQSEPFSAIHLRRVDN